MKREFLFLTTLTFVRGVPRSSLRVRAQPRVRENERRALERKKTKKKAHHSPACRLGCQPLSKKHNYVRGVYIPERLGKAPKRPLDLSDVTNILRWKTPLL